MHSFWIRLQLNWQIFWIDFLFSRYVSVTGCSQAEIKTHAIIESFPSTKQDERKLEKCENLGSLLVKIQITETWKKKYKQYTGKNSPPQTGKQCPVCFWATATLEDNWTLINYFFVVFVEHANTAYASGWFRTTDLAVSPHNLLSTPSLLTAGGSMRNKQSLEAM